jgi:peptidoglycan/LPS O-acetylase OafA/YrhL
MALTRKDLAATFLTALVVLVYATTHEGWNVWLIGSSHRWATGAILLLGMFTCGLGTREKGRPAAIFPVLGIAAFVLAVLAFVSASLTPLSLLVLDIVVLWAVATIRHATRRKAPRQRMLFT